MLIRWAAESDLPAWFALATEMSSLFQHPADIGADPEFISYAHRTVKEYQVLTAVDYMSGNNMGFISISRRQNSIAWFAVWERYRSKGVGSRLLKTALRQLDHTKPITVEIFRDSNTQGIPARNLYKKYGFIETESNLFGPHGVPNCRMTADLSGEKRGGSFHYRFPEFIKAAQKKNCPACNHKPMPDGQIDIFLTDKICVGGEYPGQGRLFGKLYVMPMEHYFHFEDMPEADAAAFMNEVQCVGRALRKVTGAVKINYEMHANSGAHLHIHLFPRYLDDDFPSAPIDYRVNEPAPYESYEEFLWFVEQMRKELSR